MKWSILNVSVIIFAVVLGLILIITIFWRLFDFYIKKNKNENLNDLGFFDKKTIRLISDFEKLDNEILINILVKNKFSVKKYSIFNQLIINNNYIYSLSNLISFNRDDKILINKNGLFLNAKKIKKIENWNPIWLYDQKKWLEWKFKDKQFKIIILIDENMLIDNIDNQTEFEIFKISQLKNELIKNETKKINIQKVKKIFLTNNIFKTKNNGN
ncbi:hypothetical protein [[Mycoplasma] collis]|uniref:hypothetical protein n=1 Tax=[Mycoplasma] collis TaxID=2127 RepID=UPI00051C0F7E|nr:hypothetical protein [[Mycoplasma] collis]